MDQNYMQFLSVLNLKIHFMILELFCFVWATSGSAHEWLCSVLEASLFVILGWPCGESNQKQSFHRESMCSVFKAISLLPVIEFLILKMWGWWDSTEVEWFALHTTGPGSPKHNKCSSEHYQEKGLSISRWNLPKSSIKWIAKI